MAIFVLTLSLSAIVGGATFTVTKTADTNDGTCDVDCSLREAISASNAAASDDVITFNLLFNTAQTIVLGGTHLQVENNGTLTINGTGSDLLTIDANQASTVLLIEPDASAVINGLKIRNGGATGFSSGGGIRNQLGNITINNSVLTNNATGSGGEGGGLYSRCGNVTINGTTISNNSAGDQGGGGIKVVDSCVSGRTSTLTISSSTIDNNTTTNNGGGISSGSILTITNTTISNNSANFAGGMIIGKATELTNVMVLNNTASQRGGGIYNSSFFQPLTILSSTIGGNQAGTQGGGIFANDSSRTTITSSVVENNSATQGGGGVRNYRSLLNIIRSEVRNNSSMSGNGGGLYSESIDSQLNIDGSTIRNNSAVNGAGILNDGSDTNIANSAIISNAAASGNGGGIYDYGSGSNVILTNSTISNNSAAVGGGLYHSSYNTVNIISSTVSSNSANSHGGVFNGSLGNANIRSSIFADNTANGGVAPDFGGTITSQGYNLIENTTGAVIAGTLTGNILGADPQLLPVRLNGAITVTAALHPTSPAIDSGDPNNFPLTDQRGVARPQDGDLNGSALPDIGAYERQISSFTVTKNSDTNDQVCDQDCSLREAIFVVNSIASPDNAIIFDPAIFSTPQSISLNLGELEVLNNGTLIISGSGSSLLSISGSNQSRVFSFRTGSNAAIRRMTITGGNGQGTINSGFGGGIYFAGRQLSLLDSVVSGNSSNFAGGIAGFSGILRVSNTRINSNTAVNSVGGVFNQVNTSLEITNSIISENSSPGSGGLDNRGKLIVKKSTINNNLGGGIINFDGANAVITGSTIANNRTVNSQNGGGIYNFGIMSIDDSTINGNSVPTTVGAGGGIYNSNILAISNSTISGNSAPAGGGIENQVGTITISFSTVVQNSTRSVGGGIGGGGVRNVAGTVTGSNSIFADNLSANSGAGADFQGTLTSQGYNLIETTNGTTIIGSTTGNIVGTDPFIGPLKINGGPTRTHALRIGSPAIDAGNPTTFPTTDQRGRPRPFDGNSDGTSRPDIGAYERQANDITKSVRADFDGDGTTDLSVYRPSEGNWYLLRSQAGFNVTSWGLASDIVAPGDFDGDGKADFSVFRPSEGNWYIAHSGGTFTTGQFGLPGDIPVPADYDGDGKDDRAVFRPSDSTWYILNSNGLNVRTQAFGLSGDKPVPGDYDGDLKADLSVFRPSNGTWYRANSGNGNFVEQQWGLDGDIPVPADFDGDNRQDLAVWRPSTASWYILNSSNGGYNFRSFGLTGDVPVPGDYDGDGSDDIAVFRNGFWYIIRSAQVFTETQFGLAGDTAIPAKNISQ
ncbi:MAG: choice-of-anchor Q domain-containing protein [Pyrinomonadaceae bacterium]